VEPPECRTGLPAAEILYYDDTPAALLAIRSGRVDAIFNVNSVYTYQALTTGALRLVGNVNAGWPNVTDVGVVTPKDSGLAEVLTEAINQLIADGTYAQTLALWNLTPEAIEQSRTNPPGLPRY
jgi:polar amino acid transport system substrate-binding protein